MNEQVKHFWLGQELRTISELRERVENLEAESAALSEVAVSTAQVAAAAARLQRNLDRAAVDRADEIAQLETRLAALDGERASLAAALGERIDALEDLRERTEAHLTAAEARLARRDREEKDALAALKERLTTTRTDAEAQIDALRQGLSDLQADQRWREALDAADARSASRLGELDGRLSLLRSSAETEVIRVGALEDRTTSLEALSGDEARFQQTAARILAEALREAGASEPQRLSNALAPFIVASIRAEIRNSRDDMVEALQPIVGRLVSAAVASALADLNRQVEEALPFERWAAALKARFTRAPALGYMAPQAFEIQDILVIDRRSGALIARHPPEATDDPVDMDLMSGMLSTVVSFTEDALSRGEGEALRKLSLTGAVVYLRDTPATIVALRAVGPEPRGFEARLDALFEAFLSRWREETQGCDAAPLLADLSAAAFDVTPQGAKRRKPPLLAMLALAIFIPLGAWQGRAAIEAWSEGRWTDRVAAAVAAQPEARGMPIQVDLRDGRIRVAGLAADAAEAETLRQAMARIPSPYPIDVDLRPLNLR